MEKIIIYTDGGSRGNPGKAAIGVVFCLPAVASAKEGDEHGAPLQKFGEYLGDGLTNNEAEYRAVIFALKKFLELFGTEAAKNTELQIRSDSELLVNQMSGRYKIKNENIRSFVVGIQKISENFGKITYQAIPREKNKEADLLVNQALDAEARKL